MSFYTTIEAYRAFDFDAFFQRVAADDVNRALNREKLDPLDFLALLSPAAMGFLEPMAQKAQRLTVQYFGRTIQLFIPLYIANHCANQCAYCGFSRANRIERRKLTLAEIEAEAVAIAATGMRHLLMLTGEAREATPMDYIEAAVRLLKKYFASVSIEMFPMREEEYRRLKEAGVDGLTLYQETYDREIYRAVHLAGPKTDYRFRLDATERGHAQRHRQRQRDDRGSDPHLQQGAPGEHHQGAAGHCRGLSSPGVGGPDARTRERPHGSVRRKCPGDSSSLRGTDANSNCDGHEADCYPYGDSDSHTDSDTLPPSDSYGGAAA